MGYIEIFEMNENGAGWKALDEISDDVKLEIELGILTNEIKMLCAFCLVEIPSGTGNACASCKNKNTK